MARGTGVPGRRAQQENSMTEQPYSEEIRTELPPEPKPGLPPRRPPLQRLIRGVIIGLIAGAFIGGAVGAGMLAFTTSPNRLLFVVRYGAGYALIGAVLVGFSQLVFGGWVRPPASKR
jgi:hypothetical protein